MRSPASLHLIDARIFYFVVKFKVFVKHNHILCDTRLKNDRQGPMDILSHGRSLATRGAGQCTAMADPFHLEAALWSA
jgi:hypothetical protein